MWSFRPSSIRTGGCAGSAQVRATTFSVSSFPTGQVGSGMAGSCSISSWASDSARTFSAFKASCFSLIALADASSDSSSEVDWPRSSRFSLPTCSPILFCSARNASNCAWALRRTASAASHASTISGDATRFTRVASLTTSGFSRMNFGSSIEIPRFVTLAEPVSKSRGRTGCFRFFQ